MRRPVGYGIDFGTTNSSISIGYDNGDVDLVRFQGRSQQPYSLRSLVYLDRTGQRASGEEVIRSFSGKTTPCARCSLVKTDANGRSYSPCRNYRRGGRCQDSRLLAELKSELSNTAFNMTHSWAMNFRIEELVAVVLSELKRAADIESGEQVSRVVMGHPVAFAGAGGTEFQQQQEIAMRRLDAAARLAGFDDVAFMPEPAAAMFDEQLPEGYSIAVDFGGGTFDVAVVRVEDGVPEVVAMQGAAIGGADMDAALFTLRVADAIGLNDEIENGRRVFRFPAAVKSGMKTIRGACRLMNDPQLFFTFKRLEAAGIDVQPVRSIIHGGLAFDFYRAIEEAKIRLSEHDEVEIYFVRRGSIALIEEVERHTFEQVIEPLMKRIEEQILRATDQAGISPDEVSVVVRTGGSSSVPLFVDMLERIFPRSDIRRRPPFTSVALGLGTVATEEWGDA